jgi:hypothetical protein
MTNPWMKKNPWLSLWLSAANATLGSARGRAAAETRRQTTTMAADAIRQTTRFWTSTLIPRRRPRK